MHIIMYSWIGETKGITVHFDGCVLEGGGAERGGAFSSYSVLEIKVIISNCTLTRNNAISGGIVDIYLTFRVEAIYEDIDTVVTIETTNITDNHGASLNIVMDSNDPLHIDLIDSNIAYNRGDSGSIVQVYYRRKYTSDFITSMTVANTHFFGNTFSQLQYNSAVIQLNNVNITVTAGTTFINNMGSSIAAKSSLIAFNGCVKFMNNTAYVGAALLLDCTILLWRWSSSQPSVQLL